MIWVYTVAESGELQAKDAHSLEELQRLGEEVEWGWIDFMDPTDEELKIVSGLLEESEMVQYFREQKIFSRPESVNSHLLFSIPQTLFEDGLKTFPIYVLIKDNTILTIRNTYSSKPVKNALKTFEDCVGKVCVGTVNSSFILTRLLQEISTENIEVVMTLRENIDKIEQQALENPADKEISRSVFAAKREVSAFERILWSQRELMHSVNEGVIPMLKTSKQITATLRHPITNISRELSLLDSQNHALDSILSLQDLGMIHRIESNLIRLTIMIVFVYIIAILLKIGIV